MPAPHPKALVESRDCIIECMSATGFVDKAELAMSCNLHAVDLCQVKSGSTHAGLQLHIVHVYS